MSTGGLQLADEAMKKTFGWLAAQRFTYLPGDLTDGPGTYEELAARLKGTSGPMTYLEIPPALHY